MRKSHLVPLAAALLFAACGDDDTPDAPPPAPLEEVLPNIPFPPNGQPLQTERTGNALKLTFRADSPSDSVVAYYRGLLAAAPYRLINESSAGGITSFYVNGRPVDVDQRAGLDSLHALVTISAPGATRS